MAQYSPELIEKTISTFKNRTGRAISKEEARQAVENVSGFFQVLQEWADADDQRKRGLIPGCLTGAEGGKH